MNLSFYLLKISFILSFLPSQRLNFDFCVKKSYKIRLEFVFIKIKPYLCTDFMQLRCKT